jgi:hypothetical protein
LSFWEQPLPWALIKILQLLPKIKTPEELQELPALSGPRGAGGGLAVPEAGFVC